VAKDKTEQFVLRLRGRGQFFDKNVISNSVQLALMAFAVMLAAGVATIEWQFSTAARGPQRQSKAAVWHRSEQPQSCRECRSAS
jgi:hypothetical protein